MWQVWRGAWRDPSFRKAVLALVLVAIPVAFVQPVFFGHIGARPGLFPPDPVIAHLGPMDLSPAIFLVIYGSIVLTVARVLAFPYLILRGLHAYIILLLLRMLAMWLVVLEAPVDAIPLADPVTVFFYPGGVPFLKDLFFSGHTATIALLVPLSRGPAARYAMAAATAIVAVLVVAQHVHWTVDVLAAPFFAWLAWRAGGLSLRLCGVEGG